MPVPLSRFPRNARSTSGDAIIVGQRIRRLRLNLGLSQKELAQMTGVHLNNVHAWEKGRQNPGVRTRPKLVDALGVRPEVLFYAGGERDVVLTDVATDVMVRVVRDASASPAQLVSAAKGLLPKHSKDGDASDKLAEVLQMIDRAHAKFRRLATEILAEREAAEASAAVDEQLTPDIIQPADGAGVHD